MKTSIATVSVSGSLKEKLSAIAEAGFDGVEIIIDLGRKSRPRFV